MILEGGEMGEIMGGYFLRKVVSPEVKIRILTSPQSTKRRFVSAANSNNNNKENVNPVTGRVAGQRKWRSPLPEWYPRTPLRDITAICKAIEKRNLLRDSATPSPAPPEHQTPTPTTQIMPMVIDLTPIKILYTPELEAYEKKLTESIEKLEKMVKRNLKKNTPRVSKRETRVRTLMSMR